MERVIRRDEGIMLSQELGENWVVWTPANLPFSRPFAISLYFAWLKGYYLSVSSFNRNAHGLINYIDNKAKCFHLKKLTCKGTLRQVFIRVYRMEIYIQTCWYFRPSFVNCCPSNLLSGSTLPPFPV